MAKYTENKILTVEIPEKIWRTLYSEAQSSPYLRIINSADDEIAVLGCNANNGNPSARTANCNNAASNSNDNYCSAAALKLFGRTIIARPKWANTSEELGDTDGQASQDYDIPFYEGSETEAENASALMQEIALANKRKRLNHMKDYVTSRTVLTMAFHKMLSGKPHIKGTDKYRNWEAQLASENEYVVIEAIRQDLINETYTCGEHQPKFIKARWKGGKDRNAKVLSIYDQVVQIAMLIVTEQRFTNELTRHIYSNVKKRSLYAKDPKWSLKSQLAKYILNHPDKHLLMTDVRKFYDTLPSIVALGVVFRIVKCKFLRYLFSEILLSLDSMPIGDSLSPTIANLTMSEVDKFILKKYKPEFFAAFGDNRVYGGSKKLLEEIQEFADIYYSSRYNIEMKADWQIVPTNRPFTFCKIRFKRGFTHTSSSIKRHAVKVAYDKDRFPGYKGILMATDSKSLLRQYYNNKKILRTKQGVRIPEFTGKKVDMDDLVGKTLYLANYQRIENDKPSEYYFRFMFLRKESRDTVQVSNGSAAIKDAMEYIMSLPDKTWKKPLHIVRLDGGGYAFEEFLPDKDDVYDVLMTELGFED